MRIRQTENYSDSDRLGHAVSDKDKYGYSKHAKNMLHLVILSVCIQKTYVYRNLRDLIHDEAPALKPLKPYP